MSVFGVSGKFSPFRFSSPRGGEYFEPDSPVLEKVPFVFVRREFVVEKW